MTTWVALLRGINIGRHRRVAMGDLRELLVELGHSDVVTHLASGNAVFDVTDGRRTERSLTRELRAAVAERFEPGIPVVLRRGEDVRRVADGGHPLQRSGDDPRFLHVVFLDGPVTAATVAAVDRSRLGEDELAGDGPELFLRYADGVQGSKLTLDLLERSLGVTGTARNWHTVVRLAELAERG